MIVLPNSMQRLTSTSQTCHQTTHVTNVFFTASRAHGMYDSEYQVIANDCMMMQSKAKPALCSWNTRTILRGNENIISTHKSQNEFKLAKTNHKRREECANHCDDHNNRGNHTRWCKHLFDLADGAHQETGTIYIRHREMKKVVNL